MFSSLFAEMKGDSVHLSRKFGDILCNARGDPWTMSEDSYSYDFGYARGAWDLLHSGGKFHEASYWFITDLDFDLSGGTAYYADDAGGDFTYNGFDVGFFGVNYSYDITNVRRVGPANPLPGCERGGACLPSATMWASFRCRQDCRWCRPHSPLSSLSLAPLLRASPAAAIPAGVGRVASKVDGSAPLARVHRAFFGR